MVRSTMFQQNTNQYPDPIRIVAIAASICVNVALLALLMTPPSFTLPVDTRPDPPVVFVKRIPPPPVPPVKVEKVVKPQPLSHPVTQVIHHTDPPPVILTQPNDMNPGPPPLSQQADAGPHTDLAPTKPVEASLTALASPAPAYPRDALRDGISGTVELELLVGADGRVLSVRIVHSSGDHRLDVAASEQVLRNWRFQPAQVNGVAVPSLGRVPIVFNLEDQ